MVEVYEQVAKSALLVIGLEENATPINLVEFHELLGRRKVYEASLHIISGCRFIINDYR